MPIDDRTGCTIGLVEIGPISPRERLEKMTFNPETYVEISREGIHAPIRGLPYLHHLEI
ncbi:hypothetical protein FRC03_011102, partial [Tulasnella sp. 419]